MKKPGSLDYLKRLSDAVLDYQRNLNEEDWKEAVRLAEEIREALGTFKKVRKSANQHLER